MYGKHIVYSDGGGTEYPEACRFLNLKHHLHFSLEKSIIELLIQYIKEIEQNALMMTIFHVEK
jgi:putative transposase